MTPSAAGRPGRPVPAPFLAPALSLAILLGAFRAGSAFAGADSTSVHVEVGSAGEVSNEQFFEDVYSDTTFLGRRLHGSPENRVAGVASGEFGWYTRGGGSLLVRPDLAFGNRLSRVATSATWRRPIAEGWRLGLDPQVSWERDRSFGVDRREARAGVVGRVRRTWGDGADALELRGGGDWLDTHGSNDAFALSHRNGRVALDWQASPLLGWDRHALAEFAVRTFPDSVTRDHYEFLVSADARRDFGPGDALRLDGELVRRAARFTVPGSRDRYSNGRGTLETEWSLPWASSVVVALDGEGFHYDDPDSIVDFDWGLLRARLDWKLSQGGHGSLAVGPRFERLLAPWNAGESYREYTGRVSLEHLSPRAWYSLEPAVGRRRYDSPETPGTYSVQALHSSFDFLELDGFAEQQLPGRLRVRLLANGRLEKHDDGAQDARSLYISLDVRRLF